MATKWSDDGKVIYQSTAEGIRLHNEGTGVVSGGAITQRAAGANMSVDVATVTVRISGTNYTFAGPTNKTVTPAHATLPRQDLVYATSAGIFVLDGAAAAEPGSGVIYPDPPALPANAVPLGRIEVSAGVTTIVDARIVDERMLLPTSLSVGDIPAAIGSVRIPNNTWVAWRNAANTAEYGIKSNANDVLESTNLGFAIGTNPATTGTIRLPNGGGSGASGSIYFRNAANTANLRTHWADSSDATWIETTTGTELYLAVAGTAQARVGTGYLTIGTTAATSGLIRIPNNTSIVARNAANTSNLTLWGVNASDVAFTGLNIAIGTNPATAGAIRLPNNANINFRNAANTADRVLVVGSSDDNVYIGDTTNRVIVQGASLAIGTTPAASGVIRVPNNLSINARNAANTADLNLIYLGSNDVVNVGLAATTVAVNVGSTTRLTITDGAMTYSGIYVQAGRAASGFGGNFRSMDDTGTSRWVAGILGGAGATSYSIYDNVNAAERLRLTSGATSSLLIPNATEAAPNGFMTDSDTGTWGEGSDIVSIVGGALRVARFAGGASKVNYLRFNSVVSGSYPQIIAEGADANAGVNISAKGSAPVTLYGGDFGRILVQFTESGTTAVNYIQMSSRPTGAGPWMRVLGADANIPLNLSSKGTSPVAVFTGDLTRTVAHFLDATSAVNYLAFQGAATGGAVLVSAAGSDASVPIVIDSKGATADVRLRPGGVISLAALGVASAVNYVQVTNAITGNYPSISVGGTDATIGLVIDAKGATSDIRLRPGGSVGLMVRGVASAVNYTEAWSAVTGGGPAIIAAGSDVNVHLSLSSKAAGNVDIWTGGVTRRVAQFLDLASSVNYLTLRGSATGGPVRVSADGSDAAIGMALYSKGDGAISIGTTTHWLDIGRSGATTTLTAASGSADIGLTLTPKGTGIVTVSSALDVDGAYVSIGTTPATAFAVRLPNNNYISWRNAANTANVSFGVTASNGFLWDNGTTGTMALSTAGELTLGGSAAVDGIIRIPNNSAIKGRNVGNTADVEIARISSVNSDVVLGNGTISLTGTSLVDFAGPPVGLGGGAAPTFGTIGGAGPATAAQNSWLKIKIAGVDTWIPVWR